MHLKCFWLEKKKREEMKDRKRNIKRKRANFLGGGGWLGLDMTERERKHCNSRKKIYLAKVNNQILSKTLTWSNAFGTQSIELLATIFSNFNNSLMHTIP